MSLEDRTGTIADDHVTVESGSERIVLTLDRPEKANALPRSTVATLTDAFASVEPDDASVVVVRGRGTHFSVGADLTELDPNGEAERRAVATAYSDLVVAIRACPLPVVAAVRGRAVGAGFLLALAADFVVATAEATFSAPEVQLGLPIAGFTTAVLPAITGEHVARDWLFTGRDIPCREAYRAGFVSRVAEEIPLDEVVDSLVKTLMRNSSTAIASLKDRMAEPVRDPETLRETEAGAMERAFREGDASERINELLQ